MIERRAEFIHELNDICENIVKHDKLNYDQKKMKERFLEQASASPENIQCIENLEYAIVMKDVPYFNGKQRKFSVKMVDYLKKALIYGHTRRISS